MTTLPSLAKRGRFMPARRGHGAWRAAVALLLLCLLALCAPPARAAGPLVLDPSQAPLAVAPVCQYLEDPGRSLTLADLSRPPWRGRFVPHDRETVEIGFSNSAWWFRFRLSPGAVAAGWVLEVAKPGLGQVDLYIPRAGGGHLVKQAGVGRPTSRADADYRGVLFELPLDFDPQGWFYLRLRSAISLNTPITLWTPGRLADMVLRDYLGFGVIYGVLLAMILYNFSLFFNLRDGTYLYYVGYVAATLCHLLFLYGHGSTLMHFTFISHERVLLFTLGLAFVMGGLFLRVFLNTRQGTPRLDKVILAFVAALALLSVYSLLGSTYWANRMINPLCGLGAALGLLVAVWRLRQGFKPAIFFLLAWAILLVGIMLYTVGGILIPRTFITVHTIAIGTAAEAILLSFALSHRIRTLQRERELYRLTSSRYRQEAQTDAMTGLYNRRHFNTVLPKLVREALWGDRRLSLIMLDVDGFKSFNDTHGHPMGDQVLKGLAQAITGSIRGHDMAFRHGGEEFAVIMPAAQGEQAKQAAERIRKAMADRRFAVKPTTEVSVTVSLGVATLEPGLGVDELVRLADGALYLAKSRGKNRTEVARPAGTAAT